MNKVIKFIGLGLAATLVAASFAACGGKSDSGSGFTVSFDTQGGSAIASQKVKGGEHAKAPENDPTKAEYTFNGWCKDADGNEVYDFDAEVISSDTTIYASWISASAGGQATAKFYANYTGAPNEVFETKSFTSGGRIAKPNNPERAGYKFDGWYTDTTYTTTYGQALKYTGDQNFYAKWLKTFVMEAEETQLTDIEWTIELDGVVKESGEKKGSNFSGDVSGKALIRESTGASGGKFVWGCMNLEEGYLDFEFTSNKADSAAKLTIVVSAEFWGFKLNPNNFKVLCNPTSNADASLQYSEIDLTFVKTSTESTTNPTWVTAYINVINIKEGKNVIRLLVNNSTANSVGTIKAQGPLVDCIKIDASDGVELSMIKY